MLVKKTEAQKAFPNEIHYGGYIAMKPAIETQDWRCLQKAFTAICAFSSASLRFWFAASMLTARATEK